jgi:catechol 2,3-dioxygenase-like lactoylglutathione lyase family enzyme
MFHLPTPKLGNVSAITITTPDLERSYNYWKELGFSEVMRADFPFPWIQISDGALLIMLRKDNEPYIALTYYVKDINNVVADLESNNISFVQKPKDSDLVKKYVLKTPDGFNISLVNVMEGFVQPPGPTMLTMPQTDYFNPDKYVNKTCGLFGELAIPVSDLDESLEYWKKLGFAELSKRGSPYPWAIISDGLSLVGLHRSGNFSTATITFFAADMKEKIERLKTVGLDNFTEAGSSANIVLTTPEQQKVNLFKLGM